MRFTGRDISSAMSTPSRADTISVAIPMTAEMTPFRAMSPTKADSGMATPTERLNPAAGVTRMRSAW